MDTNNEDIQLRFEALWRSLLDSDDGIDGASYDNLLGLGQLISPTFISMFSRFVDATDGRFYIKGNK